MCGIVGFTRFFHETGNLETLKAMGNTIAHRGPDASGEYLDDSIGLCHRRLSIIDLSASGNQPMFSADGNLVIVFNGEIYNFQSLRQELMDNGYKFKSKSDTEVLLALYEVYGQDLLTKINGMFAFALWDKTKKQLFIARDRLGKKPLYYFYQDGYFIFASELKAILHLPAVPREIRPDSVYDFFTYQYVPDPKTIFKSIYKLEPAHSLTVTREGVEKKQYWDVSFKVSASADESTLKSILLEKISFSVKQRMVSDVPLGAFLSGGIDSSAVVGLMAKSIDKPVTTCSIGFESEEFDEVKYAEKVARQFGTDHHEFTVKQNVPSSLEKIVSYFDEPFADPSLVPTFFVSQLARTKVTVALAGDGGDESFAGYSKYVTDATENKIRALVPGLVKRKVLPSVGRFLEKRNSKFARKLNTLVKTIACDPAYGFFLTNSFMTDELWNFLVKDEFKAVLDSYHPSSVTLEHYNKADGPDHLAKILYTDLKTYLVGDILVKVDRMSMANSLEVRAPLLDYEVVEQAAKIPSKLKLMNGEKKYILKKSFEKLLDKDTLYRKKMGFSVPLAQWLRIELKELANELLFRSDSGLTDFFKIESVRDIWNSHQESKRDYSSEIWSMLMFQLWYNRYSVQRKDSVQNFQLQERRVSQQ